jgi:hypothetical protein
VNKGMTLVTLMVVLLGAGCSPPPTEDEGVIDIAPSFSKPPPPSVDPETERQREVAPAKLDPALVYEPTESVRVGQVRLSGLHVSKSPDLIDGIDKSLVEYFGQKTDNAGRLESGTYLFATVTLKNETEEPASFMAANCAFLAVAESGIVAATTRELRFNSANPRPTGKDGGIVQLAAGQTEVVVLVFIVDDAFLQEGKIYFAIDTVGGFALDDPEPNRYTAFPAEF